MDHPRDLGPFRQPTRNLKRRLLMPRQPHAEAAQTPQAEIDVLRPDAETEILMRLGDRSQGFLVHGDGAEHDVGMATDIFRRRLNGHVGTMGERLEIERRRPSIVENDHRAGSVRGLGDGRDVLHFESLRAGRFGENDFRLLGDELCDVGTDAGVVIGDRDAEPLQHVVAKSPRRTIDAVHDEQLVARGKESEKRGGDGRKARRREQRAVAAFKFGDRFFERPDRGRT